MHSTWQRLTAQHPHAVDAGVASMLFGVVVVGCALDEKGFQFDEGLWPAAILAALACGALMWHRTRPRLVVVVTVASALVANMLGYLVTPLLLAPSLTAVYWLALASSRRTAYTWAGSAAAVQALAALAFDPGHFSPYLDVLNTGTWFLPAAWRGQQIQWRRIYFDAVHARAEHAEQDREKEARRRVAEERVRIARELHDVIAHHLAVANAQAGTAAHLVSRRPEQAQQLLDELARTTSQALRELKSTVGLLRREDDPEQPLEPAPGLDRLPELIAAFEAAGLRVRLTSEGQEQALPAGVDLTAYRIVQEALTNVTKHAATSTAHVRLVYSRRHLSITVTDDGTANAVVSDSPPSAQGFGLIGMRERAQSVGGELRTGPRPDGGFEVSTALPLDPAESTTTADPDTPHTAKGVDTP
jgi:signal transduction histidine kinase